MIPPIATSTASVAHGVSQCTPARLCVAMCIMHRLSAGRVACSYDKGLEG